MSLTWEKTLCTAVPLGVYTQKSHHLIIHRQHRVEAELGGSMGDLV